MENNALSLQGRGEPILSLTGARFLAALAIFVHHAAGYGMIPTNHGLNLSSGVSFFFVLSGFILYHSYSARIGSFSFKSFILLRFLRLWPAHLAALLLVCLLNPRMLRILDRRYEWWESGSIVFLLQSWIPEQRVYFGWNGPSWSISTEMFFYAAFPFLLLGLKRSISATLLLTVALTGGFVLTAYSMLEGSGITGVGHGIVGINPIARLHQFAVGMAVAMALPYARGWFGSRSTATHLFAEIILVATLALALVYSGGWMAQWPSQLGFAGGRYSVYLALGVMFSLVILLLASVRLRIARWLESPLLRYGGDISFSLYLVHQPVLIFVRRHYGEKMDNWLLVLIALAMSLAFSSVIFHLIEVPIVRWSKRVFRRRVDVAEDKGVNLPG